MSAVLIERGFVRIADGLAHYRSIDPANRSTAVPLYMAHASPGSSQGLTPLMTELGRTRRVIAPDMLGNGDSDPPQRAQTDMAYYVDCAIQIMDQLGIEQVDFYGLHTGAHIGCELALTHPERVRFLVLDGISLFSAELKAQLLAHYAPVMQPDDYGGHLAWVWNFVRDLTVHFPYFMRDPAHRLHHAPVPPPAVLHKLALDVLKALPTYHLAYHAAFNHPAATRLPLLRHPTLVTCVNTDPLVDYLEQAAILVPHCQKQLVLREQRGAVIEAFLNASHTT